MFNKILNIIVGIMLLHYGICTVFSRGFYSPMHEIYIDFGAYHYIIGYIMILLGIIVFLIIIFDKKEITKKTIANASREEKQSQGLLLEIYDRKGSLLYEFEHFGNNFIVNDYTEQISINQNENPYNRLKNIADKEEMDF